MGEAEPPQTQAPTRVPLHVRVGARHGARTGGRTRDSVRVTVHAEGMPPVLPAASPGMCGIFCVKAIGVGRRWAIAQAGD